MRVRRHPSAEPLQIYPSLSDSRNIRKGHVRQSDLSHMAFSVCLLKTQLFFSAGKSRRTFLFFQTCRNQVIVGTLDRVIELKTAFLTELFREVVVELLLRCGISDGSKHQLRLILGQGNVTLFPDNLSYSCNRALIGFLVLPALAADLLLGLLILAPLCIVLPVGFLILASLCIVLSVGFLVLPSLAAVLPVRLLVLPVLGIALSLILLTLVLLALTAVSCLLPFLTASP